MADEQKLKFCKETIIKLHQRQQQEDGNIQELDEKMLKALRQSENSISEEINADSSKRRESDARIQREIQKSLGFDMQLPLANQRKMREETHQKYVQVFSEQISSLSNEITQEFSQTTNKL